MEPDKVFTREEWIAIRRFISSWKKENAFVLVEGPEQSLREAAVALVRDPSDPKKQEKARLALARQEAIQEVLGRLNP